MLGQKAGLTIVRNINAMSHTGGDRPGWSHVGDALRRERSRTPAEIEADYGETASIALSLSRIERARKTSRGRAVPF